VSGGSEMSSQRLGKERTLTPLQQRFIKVGLEGFKDREVIELLLLSPDLPPKECKKLAKQVVEKFKTLRQLVAATSEELYQAGVTPRGILHIGFVREIAGEVLKQEIIEQPVYKSPEEVFNYLYYSMRDLKNEVFKAIYLNNRHQIIDTADLFEGTLESIPIRPREIVESAIKHDTAAIIFAHNHPSGDPSPSRSDKQFTRDLVFVGNIIQIKVLDHIIIGGNRYFSFADEGLIQKYQDEFLNMRIKTLNDRVPLRL
jgi:DNA repair protein RadC